MKKPRTSSQPKPDQDLPKECGCRSCRKKAPLLRFLKRHSSLAR